MQPKTKLKTGDEVVVISGEFVGARGAILGIDRKKMRAQLEGVSKGKKKAQRKTAASPQGGLVDRIETIHVSNLMPAADYDARQQKREAQAG